MLGTEFGQPVGNQWQEMHQEDDAQKGLMLKTL